MFWKELVSRVRSAISPSCSASAPGPKISGIALHRHRRQMDTRFKDRPLLAVIGCTGTGKTKLGVRLAKELDGEVVSADSIQVYKGLDVATNKATEEETDGVPHHMMGTVDWDYECNVHEYRNEALKIIDDIYSRGKVPVVVGGTSYYIESLIYDNLVPRPADKNCGNEDNDNDEEDDDCDGDGRYYETEMRRPDDLSVDAFREYAPFRHCNDKPTAATAEAAGRLYVDALAEAVRFARTMAAVGRLSSKRYRNTFTPDDPAAVGGGGDACPPRWPSAVAECETAALYAHGVRVLDAVATALAAAGTGIAATVLRDVRFDVSAADVAIGHRERYARADVRSRLDGLLQIVAGRDTDVEGHLKAALCRMYAEVESRTQRLALALLVDHERTAVDLVPAADLKAHAAYFDPVAANELHPHNTRKVFRTIQIYLTQGKRKSKLYEEQRTQVCGSDVPVVALRFKEVHMLWLTCDVDVLNSRLDCRTEEMVERGLVDELCRFKNQLAKKTGTNNFSLDFTKGVLQCIGVKQFQQYLELPNDIRETEEGRKAYENALTAMKYVTKKYARRQVRWINNRFLNPCDKQTVSVYKLDCTDLGNWQQLSDQAVDLAHVVLGRKPRTEYTLEPMSLSVKAVLPVYGDYHCNDCSRLFSNDIQYNIHMASKKHVKVMKKRKRKLLETNLPYNSDNKHKFNSLKKS